MFDFSKLVEKLIKDTNEASIKWVEQEMDETLSLLSMMYNCCKGSVTSYQTSIGDITFDISYVSQLGYSFQAYCDGETIDFYDGCVSVFEHQELVKRLYHEVKVNVRAEKPNEFDKNELVTKIKQYYEKD